jgi:hypothetical protein
MPICDAIEYFLPGKRRVNSKTGYSFSVFAINDFESDVE